MAYSYTRLCKDHHIDTQECMVEELRSLEHTGGKGHATLDLSTQGLTPKTCAVLGKVLATDRNFTEIKFADCMLSEDALKNLAQGLAYNAYCKKLDLKGNNIKGTGVEALGKMLHHNRSLASICLEWNSLGMLENLFVAFCDGLAANSVLLALDLRNNQINHSGAEELCMALKRNITLRALDLRWNNIGLLGGRAFIEMLKANKILSRLELAGNNVPTDISRAIETSVDNNADRQTLSGEHSKRTNILSQHLRHVEREKTLQITDLVDQIDMREEQLRKSKRTSTLQVGHLQEALEERKVAFSSLAAKLSMTASELALTEQKVNDHSGVINRLKQELTEVAVSHQDEIKKEQEGRAQMEMKYLQESSVLQDKHMHSQNKCDNLDRKCRQQQEQVFELKEQLAHLQAELKLKGCQFEEQLSSERQRHKDMQRDMESTRSKELGHLKQEAGDTERALRERIQKMEALRLDLEEETSRLKSSNLVDKLNAEETLQATKLRIKAEEAQRHGQLEERVRVLQTSKGELQGHCNQQASLVAELQTKNSGLTLEVEHLKRRMEEMGQELAEKHNYTAAQVGKVKIELNQTMSRLEGERSVHADLRDKLAQADKDLSEQLLRHRLAMEEKDRELITAREKLRAREMAMQRAREEESQRVQMLQMAFMSFVAMSPK